MGCFRSKQSKLVADSLQVQPNNVNVPPAAPAAPVVPQAEQKIESKADPVPEPNIFVQSVASLLSLWQNTDSTTVKFNKLQDALVTEFEAANGVKVASFVAEENAIVAEEVRKPAASVGAVKNGGYGYAGDSGNKGDQKAREAKIALKLKEQKKHDQSVSNCMAALLECLKTKVFNGFENSLDQTDVSNAWVASKVFNGVVEFYLREAPAADMIERWTLYEQVFAMLTFTAEHPTLTESFSKKYDLKSRVQNVLEQFNLLAKMNGKNAEKRELECTEIAINTCNLVIKTLSPSVIEEVKEEKAEVKYDEAVQDSGKLESKYDSDDQKLEALKQLIQEKKQFLSDSRVDFVDLESSPFHFQTLYANSANDVQSKQRLARLRKEITSLKNSLPEGIFLRVNQDRYDKMRVLITGPGDTPYENGLFMFDLYLPPQYPNVPPMMDLCTTGNGQFRFNPNLYANGKVCLSLLGTWSGPGWDPQVSTILQLLVSVQAMILVDYPYENEPSYASLRMSEESLAYNEGIRNATLLYAMNWLLNSKSPAPIPSYFKDVVDAHFIVNRERILSQLPEWEKLNEANKRRECNYHPWTSRFREGSWKTNKEELQKHLNKLCGIEESTQAVPEVAKAEN